MVQGLVSDIMEIRANLDEIALRENKLRRAIQYFTVERSHKDRCVNSAFLRHGQRAIPGSLAAWRWLAILVASLPVGDRQQTGGRIRCGGRRCSTELTAWRGRDDNLTMSRSFNRFSMKKPMASFERHAYSSTGSLLDHRHIYSHLSPKSKRLR